MELPNPDSETILSQKPKSTDLIIVGIGASAGGIQALKVFFENTPADSGMAARCSSAMGSEVPVWHRRGVI